jgi:hypothetical protein
LGQFPPVLVKTPVRTAWGLLKPEDPFVTIAHGAQSPHGALGLLHRIGAIVFDDTFAYASKPLVNVSARL